MTNSARAPTQAATGDRRANGKGRPLPEETIVTDSGGGSRKEGPIDGGTVSVSVADRRGTASTQAADVSRHLVPWSLPEFRAVSREVVIAIISIDRAIIRVFCSLATPPAYPGMFFKTRFIFRNVSRRDNVPIWK